MITRESGGLLAFRDRQKAARLLGAPLPNAATRLRFAVWQPSDDLAYHEALIRFDAPHDDYLALVRARGLILFSISGPNVHLPSNWSAPAAIEAPSWWQPSVGTPPDAASGKVGLYGSIAMKWENGSVYALIVDTGQRPQAGGARQ